MFDLDDTLVPVMGPIMDATRTFHAFAEEHMAKTSPTVQAALSSEMKRCHSLLLALPHVMSYPM